MSMMIEMRFEACLLRVNAKGKFSLNDAKRTFLEILDSVSEFHAEKILFDGRELKGKPSVMERFFYGEFAAQNTRRLLSEKKIHHTPQFAFVLLPPLRDPQRFGETVAVNRGMKVKTFETLEEAFEWLEITPANKPDPGDGGRP